MKIKLKIAARDELVFRIISLVSDTGQIFLMLGSTLRYFVGAFITFIYYFRKPF